MRFYTEKLGFKVAFDARLPTGKRWVAVAPPDGSAVLTLIEPTPQSAEYKLIGRATRIIFVTDDVAATFREWSERGVRFRNTPRLRRIKYEKEVAEPNLDPTLRHGSQEPIWGQIYARFEDLDGNGYSLVSFDEVSKALEAQRRAEAEKLEVERRAAYEIEIAKQVQSRLLPRSRPTLRTLECAGVCTQARQVGGDYYDFLSLGPGRVGVVIGDVSGKGIGAALLMANLQANLRSQSMLLDHPQQTLRSVNQLFLENTDANSYATLFFGEYRDEDRRLQYVNCGHLPGLVFRKDGEIERLDSTCTVLGLFSEWDCEVEETVLRTGDVLALYTDGVTECFNDAGDEFGEQGLVASLQAHRLLPVKELAELVLEDVQRFGAEEQSDDITLIVAKCVE